MKRRKLIRHLEAHGCPLKREGASHSIYWNPETGRRDPSLVMPKVTAQSDSASPSPSIFLQ